MSAMEDDNNQGKKFTFKPQLSFDGVAIITGVIFALIWIGELKANIKELQQQNATYGAQLHDVQGSIYGLRDDVSVLQTVVVERTGKPLK